MILSKLVNFPIFFQMEVFVKCTVKVTLVYDNIISETYIMRDMLSICVLFKL